MNLRIPGPTPLPPQVVKAMQRPMINHRSAAFEEMQYGIVTRLQKIMGTSNDILIFPGSGTGGLEAALVNVVSPGDSVLACAVGTFGERFAQMAAAFDANVDKLSSPLAPGNRCHAARGKTARRTRYARCAAYAQRDLDRDAPSRATARAGRAR